MGADEQTVVDKIAKLDVKGVEDDFKATINGAVQSVRNQVDSVEKGIEDMQNEVLNQKVDGEQTVIDAVTRARLNFRTFRRDHPEVVIGAIGSVVTLASFRYGRIVALRNGLMGSLFSAMGCFPEVFSRPYLESRQQKAKDQLVSGISQWR